MSVKYYNEQIQRWLNNNQAHFDKRWEFMSDEELTEWGMSAINTGSAALTCPDTVATFAANGGVGVCAGAAATANSGTTGQTDAANIYLGLGVEAMIHGRMRFTEEALSAELKYQTQLYFGFAIFADTTLIGGVTDGIGFKKAASATDDNIGLSVIGATTGVASVLQSIGKVSTAALIPSGTKGATPFFDLLLHIRMDSTVANKGTVLAMMNGTGQSLSHSSMPTNLIALAPSFEFQSGNTTGTKGLCVDYIRVAGTCTA